LQSNGYREKPHLLACFLFLKDVRFCAAFEPVKAEHQSKVEAQLKLMLAYVAFADGGVGIKRSGQITIFIDLDRSGSQSGQIKADLGRSGQIKIRSADQVPICRSDPKLCDVEAVEEEVGAGTEANHSKNTLRIPRPVSKCD
jgi:hypothetical protein